MAQEIRSIRAGQKFEVINTTIEGFDTGCIVEAIDNINDVKLSCGNFRWIGGYKPTSYNYKDYTLLQRKSDLKRYRGKIK